MKLEDYVIKLLITSGASKLHIIGTCGECVHSVSLTDSFMCGSPDSERDGEKVSDGCIHWEKRDV